jgi:hypothetical protein
MPKFNPPPEFSFKPTEWSEWKQRFERYRIASKLRDEAGEIQVNSLIYAMGNQAESIARSFTYAAGEENNFDVVMQKFSTYFDVNKNVIHERANFHRRDQQQQETVEQYVRVLYDLAERCDYGAKRDEEIRDRLVVGIRDLSVSQELQLEKNLTLTKAIETARASESVKLQNASQTHTEVDAVVRPKHKSPARKDVNMKEPCGRCGYTTHRGGVCPARKATCNHCKKKGHYAAQCLSKSKQTKQNHKQKEVKEVTVNGNDDPQPDEAYFLGTVMNSEEQNEPPWTVKLKLLGIQAPFKIDSGADVSILSLSTYNSLDVKPNLEPSDTRLESVGGKTKWRQQHLKSIKIGVISFNLMIYKPSNI